MWISKLFGSIIQLAKGHLHRQAARMQALLERKFGIAESWNHVEVNQTLSSVVGVHFGTLQAVQTPIQQFLSICDQIGCDAAIQLVFGEPQVRCC